MYLQGDELRLYTPKRNLEFLSDLISDMTHDDPSKRLKMDEVVARFEVIRQGLSWWKLRSKISEKNESFLFRMFCAPYHWAKQSVYVVRRISAIPQRRDISRN